MSWPSILFILILVITERVVYTQHCYACSNINSSKMLAKLEDKNWRNWLSNANKFPHGLTDNCLDEFVPEIAIRSGARSTNCPNGTCLKLSINEHRGESYIWRSCIANSAKEIRTDCTKINTNQGELELCTCSGNMCNLVSSQSTITILTLIFGLSFTLRFV